MTPDHDTAMRAHAAARHPVTVTEGDRHVLRGTLVAWRPHRTRTGANGQPISRSTYAAVVQPDGNPGTRTYPLNRYDITPEPT